MSDSFRHGLRAGLPFSVVGFLVSMSFGVLAVQAGFSPLQAIGMSAVVHPGAAEFAVTAIVAAGGGVIPGVLAATLMNTRFLAMGVAVAPSMPGRPVARALHGQAVIDPSWALANRGDGTFDRLMLFDVTVPQYVGWVSGTVVGAFAGDVLGDVERFGPDAVYPTFFLALLAAELRDRRSRSIAVLTAVIKAAGPLLLGGRQLTGRAMSVISLLPPVPLAALVVTSAFADGQRSHVDASTVGVAVAGVLIWQRRPLLLSVLAAVVVTASMRAVS